MKFTHLVPSRRSRGFTLIELLVVIAIIAILASMLLPALAKAKMKGMTTVSMANTKQIGLAFFLYWPDHNEISPGCASKGSFDPMIEDWIWWNVKRSAKFEDPQKSALGPYIQRFQTNLFRCPADRWVVEREKRWVQLGRRDNPYLYSYTAPNLIVNQGGRDVSLGITSAFGPNIYIPFKVSNIKNASRKLVLLEENQDPSLAIADDGRYVPTTDAFGNVMTGHHAIPKIPVGNVQTINNVWARRGKGVAFMADGHSEAVTPAYAFDPLNHDATK